MTDLHNAREAVVEAATALLTHRVGEYPLDGYLRDNDSSRADIDALATALAAFRSLPAAPVASSALSGEEREALEDAEHLALWIAQPALPTECFSQNTRDNCARKIKAVCAALRRLAPASGLGEFNFAAHLAHQAAWSEQTFGPGKRTAGVCDHIRKELVEVEADPEDSAEWIDVVILALDGAWRSGMTPEQIIAGIVAKQRKNEGRNWPNWRTADPNAAIEHCRTEDEQLIAAGNARHQRLIREMQSAAPIAAPASKEGEG